jgi:hypothetical protein
MGACRAGFSTLFSAEQVAGNRGERLREAGSAPGPRKGRTA